MTTNCDRNVLYGRSIDDATPEEWDAATSAFTVHPSDLVIEEPVKEKQFDAVARLDHYNTGSIEAIEAIKASMHPQEFKGYLKGNCMKYLWRYEYKGKPVEDLRKCRWYLEKLIEENL